jgi:Heparinase II/III-like protein
MRTMVFALAFAMIGTWGGAAAVAGTPQVRKERPRLFMRAKAWDGPSVQKIKSWMNRPEYQKNLGRLKGSGFVDALRYQILGDQEAGKRAVSYLKALNVPTRKSKDSPSYTGLSTCLRAATYDWMRNHPDFDAESRKKAIAHFEWWGDYFYGYLPGCVPFYSRNSGATSGLTACALALHGDSPKADKWLVKAQKYLKENLGTIRQAEDGATGGATYGMVHQFTDTSNTAAMWRSATDWDAAKWIKEKQGNWLERQMLYQIWFTYPNGWLWKEGDLWTGSHRDRNEHANQVLAIAGMYKNGVGMTHADAILKRWGMASAYYKWRSAWWYLYNNPEIKREPCEKLGQGALFSPGLHAYGSWRSSWKKDATCVTFKFGDNVDHHGTWDTGKFMIFKGAPLAIKNGYYKGYKSSKHYYYKSPWSANVVLFDGKNNGWQKGMPDLDRNTSWSSWKKRRDGLKHPVAGKLVAHEVKKEYARALADLSGSTYPTGSKWQRELVFLGYKYVLVLDRVKPGAGTKTRWLLHSIKEPKVDAANMLATIDNGKARLFVKSLLPQKAKMLKVGGGDKVWIHKNRRGKDLSWGPRKGKPSQQLGVGRFDVVPADETAECVYLHVLYPTETSTASMPACSVSKSGAGFVVKVGNLSHTFKPGK